MLFTVHNHPVYNIFLHTLSSSSAQTTSMETIVFYTPPNLTHLISMVELAKQLLNHSHSLSSIIFLLPTFPTNDTTLTSFISSVSSAFPSITFHSLPQTPLSQVSSKSREAIIFETLHNNNDNVCNALQSLSLDYTISACILDFYCHSTVEIVQSLNIPTYFFFTTNANCLALFLNFPVFDKITSDSFRNTEISLEIPGLFSVPTSHLLEPMLDRGASYDGFVQVGEAFTKANGIIVNTFEALEFRAVMGLKQGTCLPGTRIPPIYCVGPLIVDNGFDGSDVKGEKHECLSWLDTQPSQSVVFLSFGSRGRFSKEQTREIAFGLERSGVRFLWVVRAPSNEDKAKMILSKSEVDLGSLLPDGFLDRTKGRGLVAKSWVPQIAVLRHESIGGFVTHCGWNSTLEAVTYGVPMIAWPLYAEQRFNKIVLVEEIKIALPMNESSDRFVSANEVEMRVKQLMETKEGDGVRERVLELKNDAKAALSERGSAKVALAKLVKSWK